MRIASVGCLHVRPILNMKDEQGAKKMRAIAEEAFAMVREYKGSHSGEHGDGSRVSEFHESMFGAQIVRAFEEVKDVFGPDRAVQSRQDRASGTHGRRRLFRYKPEYQPQSFETVLDWSAWGAVPAPSRCATTTAPAARPSRASCARLPRERATNSSHARTAPTPCGWQSRAARRDSLGLRAMRETMALCVSCKGCKREWSDPCRHGRAMKIEFMHQYRKRMRRACASA